MKKIPPLHALHCFECVSRHLSVKHAAEEMHVTPAAISQQISKLESILGVALFVRHARNTVLSEAGLAYFLDIRNAFRQLEDATRKLSSFSSQPVVTLSCTTVFAMQYLLPRLPFFHAKHPAIDVRISTTHRLVDFAHDDIDLAVRHGLGVYPGLQSELLIDDALLPVCSPALMRKLKRLKSPDELSDFTLLHNEDKEDWRLWLEATNAQGVDWARGPIFVDANTAIEAAIAGYGVALARKSLVGLQLREGRLIMPFKAELKSKLAYYLVYPSQIALRQESELFRSWLQQEVAVAMQDDQGASPN